jgi:hypothetical protein
MPSFAKIVERRWKMKDWVRSIGGLILTGETEVSGESPGPVSLFHTQNPQNIFTIRITF